MSTKGPPRPRPKPKPREDAFIVKKIHTKDVTKKMTLNVEVGGVKSLKFRLAIGVALIRLACRIIGCQIKVTDDTTESQG